jgi:phosphohistidine swiveling domain-containing protein
MTTMDTPAASGPPTSVGWDYWLSTWPDHPVAVTRANGSDAYPDPLTPLSQELILRYEDQGIRRFYTSTARVLRQSDIADPFFFAVWGLVFLNADNMAMLGEGMPGSSPQGVFRQFFGLEPDPDYVPPAQPLTERVRQLAVGLRALPTIVRRGRGLPDQVRTQSARVIAARPSGDLGELSEQALLAWLERLDSLQVDCWHTLMTAAPIGAACYEVVYRLLVSWCGPEGASLTNALHSGIGGNESAEAGRAIRRLAQIVREEGLEQELAAQDAVARTSAASRRFADELSAVLERFGHRAPGELELAKPSWRADPTQLLRVVAIEAGRPERLPDRSAAVREAAQAELARRLSPLRCRLAGGLLRASRFSLSQRENGKVPVVKLFDELRRLLDVAGRRLAERGVLPDPGLVGFLRHAELHEVLAGGNGPGCPEIERRAAEHRACFSVELPELIEVGPSGWRELGAEYIRSKGLLPMEKLDPDATQLTGIPAAAGILNARARVLGGPDDQFEAGDILVAHAVDPGWAPILACAGGLVLDIGGLMSHGVIVARELGIPCVANVKYGTQLIRDGQIITIDGTAGQVLLGRALQTSQ